MDKKYKVYINAQNKEIALNKIKSGFFSGTNRKIVSSKLFAKKGTKKAGSNLYNRYEIIYKE